MHKYLLAGMAVFAFSVAQAQLLEKASVIGEALQYSKQGNFRGCGLNLNLLKITELPVRDLVAVSINFWLESPEAALVKTSLSEATAGATPSLKPKKIESGWIRLADAKPVSQLKVMPGEDGAVLFLAPISEAIDLLSELSSSERTVQVGFKQRGKKLERVFYGKMQMEAQEKSALGACFEELQKNYSLKR